MRFAIWVNAYVLLVLKEMTPITWRLVALLCQNVHMIPIVATMRSVQKYKTATRDNVWMHAVEPRVDQTPSASPIIIIEHAFVTKDSPGTRTTCKKDVQKRLRVNQPQTVLPD